MYRCVLTLEPIFARASRPMIHHAPCFFLTDVEGNYAHYQRMMEAFEAQKREICDLKLIHGGDLQKVGDDITLAKAVITHKKQNPETVLLAGNRDIQLLQFSCFNKLKREQLLDILLHEPPAFWVKQHTLQQFTADLLKCESHHLKSRLESLSLETMKAIYCQFKLKKQMGSPISFSMRRHELARLLEKDAYAISNEEVMQSFVDLIAPGGMMRSYLLQANLAHIEGDVLFVHGALTEESLSYIPTLGHTRLGLREWIAELNRWFQTHLKDCLTTADNPSDTNPSVFKTLSEYLIHNRCSIVTSNWYDKNGQLSPISPAVLSYLREAGIRCVISGHQPVGASPYPLLIKNDDVTVLVTDTNYSKPGSSNIDSDTRGEWYSPVTVWPNSHFSTTTYEGDIQKDKRQLSFTQKEPSPLGGFTSDGRLINRQLDADHVDTVQLSGLKLDNKAMQTEACQRASGSAPS